MSEIPELVRELQRAAAYGAAPSVPVQLRTTHSSWVFIVGDEVWKVKRPVDLGFLDFRTVEARRRDCEAEVRLNRRLAPHVYLGVEPVRRTPAGLRVGPGEGALEDWAVHMRRLPDAASAEAMLARGALDEAALARLAAHMARFLGEAREVPELGAPDVVRASVDQNFEQVAPFVGDLLDASTFDDVRTFQVGQLTAGAERFAARVRDRRIREGHGDLRLEHVYFLTSSSEPSDGFRTSRSHPTQADLRGDPGDALGRAELDLPRRESADADNIAVIDCISFNDRFRCGDAAGEAAFLAMELESARRPDLASGFIARFAEASDDFGLYGVLDFYLAYRAWVRGKVAAFVAADAAAPAEVRARKRAEAQHDFALARAFSGAPLEPSFLIAVGGPPGSGKSTLAEGFGRSLGAPVVGSDRTRKALAGIAPTTRGDAGLYTPEMSERTYAEMFRRANAVLASGRGVVLDATFSSPRGRCAAAELARAAGARFAFVEARCADVETLRARLASRRAGPSVSDATDELLEPLLRRYQPLGPADPQPAVTVDTAAPPAAAVTDALERLRGLGFSRPGPG